MTDLQKQIRNLITEAPHSIIVLYNEHGEHKIFAPEDSITESSIRRMRNNINSYIRTCRVLGEPIISFDTL